MPGKMPGNMLSNMPGNMHDNMPGKYARQHTSQRGRRSSYTTVPAFIVQCPAHLLTLLSNQDNSFEIYVQNVPSVKHMVCTPPFSTHNSALLCFSHCKCKLQNYSISTKQNPHSTLVEWPNKTYFTLTQTSMDLPLVAKYFNHFMRTDKVYILETVNYLKKNGSFFLSHIITLNDKHMIKKMKSIFFHTSSVLLRSKCLAT